jgi:hypothetical protein
MNGSSFSFFFNAPHERYEFAERNEINFLKIDFTGRDLLQEPLHILGTAYLCEVVDVVV